MTTVREQILQVVADKLEAVPGYRFERTPILRASDSELPRLVMRDGGQNPPATGAQRSEYTLRFEVVAVFFEESFAPDWDATYDAVIKAVQTDRRQNELALDTRETEMTDPDEFASDMASRPTVAVGLNFEVDFWTADDDPSTLGPG